MSAVERLLTELDAVRERLLVAIESLPDEALGQPGVVGEWSVGDVLVNLTVWESEVVTALMQVDQRKKPTRLLAALAQADDYDRERYAENKGRDLDLVFDDLMKVRLELEEWLEMFDDRVLTDKKRYKWLNGRALTSLIAQATFENERRYVPAMEQFSQAWAARSATQGGVIPLTAVTVQAPPEE